MTFLLCATNSTLKLETSAITNVCTITMYDYISKKVKFNPFFQNKLAPKIALFSDFRALCACAAALLF